MTERDTLTPEPTQAKDRALGAAVRNFVAVVALVVAVIVGYRQFAEAIEHEVKRETANVENRLDSATKLREATVTSELRSLREQRESDQRELARFLTELGSRMRALEDRR